MSNSFFDPLHSATAIESPIVISLDIETTDTTLTSKILSIGAVSGNILTGEVLDKFYVRLSLDGQENRTSSESTLRFWEQQKISNPLAYAEVFDETLSRVTLEEGLELFNGFVSKTKSSLPSNFEHVHIIGNGPEFDNQFIISAMETFGLKPNWRFRNNDSHRTIVYLCRLILGLDFKKTIPFTGIKHHALDDAFHEWEYATRSIQSFMSQLNR